MLSTRKQIRDSVLTTTNQLDSQLGDYVEDMINVTIQEIGDPAWAFDGKKHHLWSWLKRKTTLTADAEDEVLERDIDKIGIIYQKDSPTKLYYVPDETFFELNPDPTDTGNPRFYRLWEITGVSTKLSSADTIEVLSSSGSDTGDYEVIVTGYISGRLETETFTLNGATAVSGTKTWDARELFISKSAITNGTITVRRATGPVTLTTIGREEISPRYKVISLFPAPTTGDTCVLYIEYYKRIKELNNDNESPEFDPKWHHVVRLGTLAKVYDHLGKVTEAEIARKHYATMVKSMVASDEVNPDYIPHMRSHDPSGPKSVRLRLSEDEITAP